MIHFLADAQEKICLHTPRSENTVAVWALYIQLSGQPSYSPPLPAKFGTNDTADVENVIIHGQVVFII